jgi:hypothetical protein
VSISLVEEFNSTQGLLENYDAYVDSERETVRAQKHADIRVIQQSDITTGMTVMQLSTNQMSQLAGQTMTQIQNSVTPLRKGEAWSGGTVAIDATRGNFPVLSASLVAGTTTLTSVVTDVPVDILTGFADTDKISMALPAFPASVVTQASSFVDFTSNATGDFAAGPTASVALSASEVSLIAGDCEFRVSRSLFSGIDLSKITGVRLRIVATGVLTFRLMGIRLLPPTWTYTQVDTDTRYGRLRRGLPRTGDLTAGAANFPIVFRSTVPTSYDDPRPIDSEHGIVFNTGSRTGNNSFSIYLREMTEDFMTQLDLNGSTQSDFNGRIQPDVGAARYGSRTQSDIDTYPQSSLDALAGTPGANSRPETDGSYGSWTLAGNPQLQYSLERVPDSLSASYIQFTVQWTSTGGNVSIINSEGGGYSFTLPQLAINTSYATFVRLEECAAQLTIFALDTSGNVLTPAIFDSSRISDDFTYKRRAGRFGWRAQLTDGDAYIDSIRPRGVSFAEYRSLPYQSFTPVVGAEIFATHTPHRELLDQPTPGPFNDVTTTINRDSAQSTSGVSWRINTYGKRSLQGFGTNLFPVSDFQHTRITFDLLYPSGALASGGPLLAYLTDRNLARMIPLIVPKLRLDQWQSVTIDLPYTFTALAGEYRVLLLQSFSGASTWWIDKPHIVERAVIWDARGVVDDPWNTRPANWIPFYDNYNHENGGVMFDRRGTTLQVRGRARRQDARIDRVQFRPKYAELGRLIWAADQPAPGAINPTASFTSAAAGTRTTRVTSTATAASGNFIVNNEWNFGDGGVGVGPTVAHTYASSGAYTITLVTTDNHGNQGVTTNVVGV